MIHSKVTAWALVLFCCFSFSYRAAAETPVITNPTFGDDTYVHVPLQFGFPFYGEVFTNSWMHSNGVVSFLNPTAPMDGGNPGAWAFCCSGLNLSPENVHLGANFRYFIAPLWTDLYPTHQATFETEGTSQYQIYRWNNIAEISNFNNLNTFSLEIRPTGFIGVDYSLVNVTNQIVSAGIVGDPTLGQMQSFYFGVPGTSLNNWSVTDTPVDYCFINPLYSPQCPGYNEAYHDQQCYINPLYATTCFGYQQAYYDQQCSLNPSYDSGCPNYVAVTVPSQEPIQTTEQEVIINLDGTISTDVPLVSDPVVNSVITKKTETKDEEASSTTRTESSDRRQTARRPAPKPDPENQSESEKEFEKEIASQAATFNTMALVPGFDAYTNSIIPDLLNREMQRQYNRPPVDNARAQRQLNAASDRLHREMVNEQYKR